MAERKTNAQIEILKQLKELKETAQITRAEVGDINTILTGAAKDEKPGLMERVRNIENWIASEKKLMFLIVGVIIVDIVTRLWNLVVK